MRWVFSLSQFFLFLAPFLYHNDSCFLHVCSFPTLGWQKKGTKMARQITESMGIKRAEVSIFDKKALDKTRTFVN